MSHDFCALTRHASVCGHYVVKWHADAKQQRASLAELGALP